jgi:hypothetical protein
MTIIELDATQWRTPADFSRALLAAVGAPEWNGTSIDALIDSLIWDGLNKVKPPYIIRVQNASRLSQDTAEEIQYLRDAILRQRAEFVARHGHDVEVSMEIVP